MATEVVIPMLGVTVENGKIVEWLKNEGDTVEKGESIFVVEADKVTTEVESPASGILAKILLPAGEEVPVLTVVAVITEPGEEIPPKYLTGDFQTQEPAMEPSIQSHHAGPIMESRDSGQADEPLKIVPAARKLARDKGLDITTISGTGPDGVILYRDIEIAASAPPARKAKISTLAERLATEEGITVDSITGSGVRGRIMRADVRSALQKEPAEGLGKIIPMDSMRQVIARKMSESAFTAPHIYFFSDIIMDPLLKFRKEILSDFETKFDQRPSINDFLIKAVALNLLEYPLLNATIKDKEIHILPEINVCLAVSLPEGLIVPAIANADRLGLADIVRQRSDLVERARSGRLSIEEIERGTFTISSLAQYDVTCFTAIINPPQSGILSIGKTRDELYLKNDAVQSRKISTFGLSVDHRIIDGVLAASFLQSLKSKLENPIFTFMHL